MRIPRLRTTRLRIASLALLAGMFQACLPSRDNDFDPTNAPHVSARVIDYSRADGACPATILATDTHEVGAASRGRCLAIDARDTRDVDGTPLSTGFSYTLLDESGAPAAPAIDGSGNVAVLDAAWRRATTPNVPLRIRVSASGAKGTASREIGFTLLNSRPKGEAGGVRSFPLGGFPWAPGPTVHVDFDGSRSSDPDGDPLRLCWTFPPAAEVCGARDDLAVRSFDVPATAASRFVATLRVDDGDCSAGGVCTRPGDFSSLPRGAIVEIHQRNAWLSVDALLERVEIDQSESVITGEANQVQLLAAARAMIGTTAGVAFAYQEIGGFPNNLNVSAGPVSGPFPLGDNYGNYSTGLTAFAANVERGALYDQGTLRRYLFSAGLTPQLDSLSQVPARQTYPSISSYAIAVAPDATTWVATRGAFGIGGVDGLGVLTRIDPAGGEAILTSSNRVDFSAIAVRPQSQELWSASVPGSGQALPSPFGLIAWDGTTPVVLDSSAGLSGIAWVNDHEVWVHRVGIGFDLLDADIARTGAGIDVASIASAPYDDDVEDMVADPETGALYAGHQGSDTLEVMRDGTLRVFAGAGSPPRVVLPDGRFPTFTSNTGVIAFSRAVGYSGVISSVTPDTLLPAGQRFDSRTGGLWIVRGSPSGLLHVGPDNSQRFFASALDSTTGDAVPFAAISSLWLSPDGTRAWLQMGNTFAADFYRVDLTSDPLRITLVAPASALYDSATNESLGRFIPSAPVPSQTPFLWAVNITNAANRLVTIPADAQGSTLPITPAYDFGTLGQISEPYWFALAPRTNDLCVSEGFSGPAGVSLHRVRAPGQGTTLDFTPTFDFTHFGGAASFNDENTDLCWFFVNDGANAEILGYDPVGTTPDKDFTLSGVTVVSILPTAPDRIIAIVDVDGAGSAPLQIESIEIGPGTTPSTVVTTLPATLSPSGPAFTYVTFLRPAP